MKRKILSLSLGAVLALGALAVPAHASATDQDTKILTHQAVGEQVSGTANLDEAAQLDPGASQDALPVTGKDAARYYKLPAIEEGENLHVTAQLIIDPMNQPTSRANISFTGRLVTADGKTCSRTGSSTVSRSSFDRPALASLSTGIKRADGYGGCLSQGNGEAYLKLERTGTWQADTDIPVELHVIVEPALDHTTLSGQTPAKLPPANVNLSGPAEPVSGGSGFSNATELAAGSISADSVLPFEVKYYKVHLSEGQRLNYRLTMADSRDASANRLVTRTFSPLLDSSVAERDHAELAREDVGASVTRSSLTEVSRDLVDAGGSLAAMRSPGDYFITVTGAANDPRGLNPLEYELAVEVSGEATGGDSWEPEVAAEGEGGGLLGVTLPGESSWLPSTAQIGALLGGVAAALAGFGVLWLLRRRKHP